LVVLAGDFRKPGIRPECGVRVYWKRGDTGVHRVVLRLHVLDASPLQWVCGRAAGLGVFAPKLIERLAVKQAFGLSSGKGLP
jgi:hypothetical protein